MRFEEFNEADVIRGNFGKGSENPDIDIPKGYKSFHTKPAGPTSAHIIGVTPDGKEKQISTAHKELADALVRYYNSGKDSVGIQPVSMARAFGSDEYNVLSDVGIKFAEKPTDFWELDQKPISEIEFAKAKKALAAAGFQLKEYPAKEIFGFIDRERHGPMKSHRWVPEENVFVIVFKDGAKYLVDQKGASSYIRFWRRIG